MGTVLTQKELTEYNEKLRKRLKKLRKEAHVTQEQVAEELGQTSANFSKVEKGEVAVTSSILLAYSKALGISISKLVDVDRKELPEDLIEAVKYYLAHMHPSTQAMAIDILAAINDSLDHRPKFDPDVKIGTAEWRRQMNAITKLDWKEYSVKWKGPKEQD